MIPRRSVDSPRRCIWIFALLLLLAGGAAGLPETPPGDGVSPALPPSPARTAIAGTVTDEATGLPVEGLSVYAYDAEGARRAEATTGATGRYLLAGLENGYFYVATESRELGYIDEIYDDRLCIRNSCFRTEGRPVPALFGDLVPGVDFRLKRGSRISGRLLDAETLEPLPRLVVLLAMRTHVLDRLGSTMTDEDGSFQFAGLPDGDYRVSSFELAGSPEVSGKSLCPAQFQRMRWHDELTRKSLPLCLRDLSVLPPGEIDGFETGGLGAWSASVGG